MLNWFKKRPAEPLGKNPNPYSVYTRQFDLEVSASVLMDERLKAGGREFPDLTMATSIRTASPLREQTRIKSFEIQERLLGPHSLGEKPLVTVMLDHSGSMRGLRAQAAAIAADVLCEILEASNVAYELLGYTTRSWKGGQSRALWIKNGRPKWPGRLCDLLHIVYSPADKKNQRWRRDLSLLLYDDYLRENVDGEALEWAHKRAKSFGYSKWICLILSDGISVDDSTIYANGGGTQWYLADHLKSVVDALNADPQVSVGAIGIIENVSGTYHVSETVSVLSGVPLAALRVFEKLAWTSEPAET